MNLFQRCSSLLAQTMSHLERSTAPNGGGTTTGPYFHGETLDDVMHDVIGAILEKGDKVQTTRGTSTELRGVVLQVANPRARLSRTETRGKLFSGLGELCWYLAGSDALEFICYYVPKYAKDAEGGVLYGAYGPRLFGQGSVASRQFENVKSLLTRKPSSRQAVMQLLDRHDIVDQHKDIPCTCTLQFMIRNDRLELFTHMRSNDAFLGLPHDIFSFTMLQEILARSLSVQLGKYTHFVGSLHIYDDRESDAREFLEEGWQSSKFPMPDMPAGDPWPSIETLVKAEAAIRKNDPLDVSEVARLDPYWQDLVRLLKVFRCTKRDPEDVDEMRSLRRQMASITYGLFIDERLKGKN